MADSPSDEHEIRLLADPVVDQIAAGEVVERPASIVKELVENALDAHATRIGVEIRAGGTALIAVQDDGVGMSPDQLRLAVQRHATSKIRHAEDLARIGSYGFRGEALPAIAAVSSMRVLTRTRASDAGHELRIEASHTELDRTAGCPVGTRIEVADLFARIPARRKFLKRPSTEWSHAIDWLGRLAMALPAVHFDIQRDDQKTMVWPSTSDPKERIIRVLGDSQGAPLVHMDWDEAVGHIEGYVSGPEQSRVNTGGVHLYVNGRPVRDKLLRHAVIDVYRDLLPRGRFPVAVVFLTLDPARVDVNVHPAKWEVRFQEPQLVHQLIRRALQSAIQGRNYLVPGPTRSEDPVAPGRPSNLRPGSASEAGADSRTTAGDWLFADRPAGGSAPPAEKRASERVEFRSQRLLGQVLARYLVLEGEGGLLLIDQHAAHERILYERLRASWLDGGVERQGLLIPLNVDLEAQSVESLTAAHETLEQLGFDLEAFGERSVVVRAIPDILAGRDPEALVRDLADELETGPPNSGPARTRLLQAADRVFATLACHSARRFGDHLPEEEQRAILEGLDAIPWAPTCPHGRPVATLLGLHELDGRFGRRS
ncbi:MAG: DNA mismatch repair endonuclease MutL [Myxococcota bacterium]